MITSIKLIWLAALQEMWREREGILAQLAEQQNCPPSIHVDEENYDDWEDGRYIDMFDSEGSIADTMSDDSSWTTSEDEDELEFVEVKDDSELLSLGFIEFT